MVVQVNDVEMELRAEELRIGNYVNCPREDQNPFRIDLIEYACDGYAKVGMNVHKYETPFGLIDGHPLTWELNDLQPIPLTEEILLKCGFELEEDEPIWFEWEEDFRFSIHKDLDLVSWKYNTIEVRIEYLHQFQNLIFILTGQELNVKL